MNKNELKKLIQEAIDDIASEDCGCNGPKLILKEGHENIVLSEGMKYHISEGKMLIDNIYRPLSSNYFALIREARELYNNGLLSVTEDDAELLESNLGEFDEYNGIKVPLDYVFDIDEVINYINEAKDKKKLPPIGKPKRGGSKKCKECDRPVFSKGYCQIHQPKKSIKSSRESTKEKTAKKFNRARKT